MRTPTDRYKTYIFALVLLVFGLILIFTPYANAQRIDPKGINTAFVDYVNKYNKISVKHYGTTAINRIEITKGGDLVVDLVDEAMRMGRGTKGQQIGFMIDILTMNKDGLKSIGVKKIRVLIDGNLFRTYDL